MDKTLINPRIVRFDEYVKDIQKVTNKTIGAALCEGIDRLLNNHINQVLEYISIEDIQLLDIPEAKVCISSEDSNDGKRHHFYFDFSWDEPYQFKVSYLRHQSFSPENDKKADFQYFGLDELRADIDRELWLAPDSVIESIQNFSNKTLPEILLETEDEQNGRYTRYIPLKSTKAGFEGQFLFEYFKDRYGRTEICYIGCEKW